MGLKIETAYVPYLQSTQLDNIYINEYMAAAPSDYVKVYIYALMYAQLGQNLDNVQIADNCELSEETVESAWDYWEDCGCIRKIFSAGGEYDIEFVRLRYLLYAADEKRQKVQSVVLEDRKVKEMYDSISKLLKRPLGGREPVEIMSWITDFKVEPDLILLAYSISVGKNKESTTAVGKIVSDWAARGMRRADEVEKYLEEVDLRHSMYKRIMKALGFSRNATEEERRLMDRWVDEMSYGIDKILEACAKTSGISNPNINYVNKVLQNWYEEKGSVGNAERPAAAAPNDLTLTKLYFEHLRIKAESDEKAHRHEIYEKLPRIKEIENEIRTCGMQMSKAMISNNANKQQQIAGLKSSLSRLEEEKTALLLQNGYEKDYLIRKYKCSFCMDTGINEDGLSCVCVPVRMEEAKEWQKTKNNKN